MELCQIVQKRIADGKERRFGEFVDRAWADKMAQEADLTHKGYVHWIEPHPAPSARAEKWEI